MSKFFELEKILDGLCRNHNFELIFATNSAKLTFFGPDDSKIGYLWIDPVWRITCRNLYVQNSYNYPYHQNYTDEERDLEGKDFENWSNLSSDLTSNMIIQKFEISAIGDLRIFFGRDYILDCFVNDIEEYCWYFSDYRAKKIFEVSTGKIEVRDSET